MADNKKDILEFVDEYITAMRVGNEQMFSDWFFSL